MAVICLYGAARENIAPIFISETEKLGKLIAENGFKMIYGAGASGLMGAAARGVTLAGGYVIGVTPHFMHKFEPVFDCTEIIETKTMAERKNVMEQNADAFIVVPGGVGTFDEFFQILTLKELGQLANKPIILFNIDGYYNELRELLFASGDKGFLRDGVLDLITFCDTAEETIAETTRQLGIK